MRNMDHVEIDIERMMDFLVGLLNAPSPTGYHRESNEFVRRAFAEFPSLHLTELPKGTLSYHWPGADSVSRRAITAHTDTLGFLVRQIKDNGRLKISHLGGISWPGAENENLTIRTHDDRRYRGTLILENPSTHVNRDAQTRARNEETMEIRLDERTNSAAETRALGIDVGNFVFLDPRVEQTESGYIRARFLDDKACVATLYAAVAALHDAGLSPAVDTCIHISNYEEFGHGGAAGLPDGLSELLTLDMAAIGEGQASSEHHVSLCVKDASGPYHFDLNNKLRRIAHAHDIELINDIYTYYSSDGSSYWRSGGTGHVALVGPGVASSHGYERTHRDALRDTARLIAAYLLDDRDD